MYDVHVAVFGQNEGGRLHQCLRSIDAALGDRCSLVTVILNGSTDNSLDVARYSKDRLKHRLQIYTIPHGDKSNAINLFFHELREPASLYVCVDAYCTINQEAISAVEGRLNESPSAHIVTGIAANGRSQPSSNRKTVEQGGVIHGQFYALRPAFLDRIRALRIRLPLGLYRGDGLIGYMACTDLRPMSEPWSNERLAGVANAQFSINQLSPWRPSDIRRHLRRTTRQMRGKLENAAIKVLTEQGGFEALPPDSDEMIRAYLATHPVPTVSWTKRPFMLAALRQHRMTIPPDPAQLRPVCSR